LTTAYYHSFDLPWSPSLAEERRFRTIIVSMLVLFLLISSVAYLVKVPPVNRFEAETVPPRLAKLVIQEKPKPPPPPPPPEEKKPQPEPEKKAAEPVPEQKKPPAPDVQAARKKAAHSGLLALSNELASLQQSDLGDLVKNRNLTKADDQAAVHRSIITSQATKGSGGISTSQLSHDAGQTKLATRTTTTVESEALSAEQQAAAAKNGRATGRSTEQIQLTLDRNKGALYALYHRALRVNPALQGKVVLEITIAPSGEVTECKVVSAELADADLIRKLVARIRLLNFGAKKVDPTVFTWPIDFLPSS
jgi:protein TonB